MWDDIQIILIVGGYILATNLILIFLRKVGSNMNSYLRLLMLSLFYALFWGISIAATGGDPGFGFPAPNLVALVMMLSIGFYQGVVTGLYIFGSWWIIIFIIMLLKQKIKERRQLNQSGYISMD